MSKSKKGTARETRQVVTAFLEHEGKILLVRRSQTVRTHQGLWAGISGYLEHAPLEQTVIEIREETGLDGPDVELRQEGQPVDVADPEHNIRWIVHPFLFRVNRPDTIRLDWENDRRLHHRAGAQTGLSQLSAIATLHGIRQRSHFVDRESPQ